MLKVAPNRSRPSKTEKRKTNLARRDFHLIGIEKAAVFIVVVVIVVAAVAGPFGSPTVVIVVALIVSVLCLGVGRKHHSRCYEYCVAPCHLHADAEKQKIGASQQENAGHRSYLQRAAGVVSGPPPHLPLCSPTVGGVAGERRRARGGCLLPTCALAWGPTFTLQGSQPADRELQSG